MDVFYVFLLAQSASRVHCNIAFGELAYNIPPAHAANSASVLVDMLSDIPFIDFEHSLSWTGLSPQSIYLSAVVLTNRGSEWALPDQLVFSTVSALLRIAAAYPEHRPGIMSGILSFAVKIVEQLESESRKISLRTHMMPTA